MGFIANKIIFFSARRFTSNFLIKPEKNEFINSSCQVNILNFFSLKCHNNYPDRLQVLLI